MHFSASSQWSKICFGYQGIIFNGKKGPKFSQIVLVRLGGGAPPPPQSGQPDRFFTVFFLPLPLGCWEREVTAGALFCILHSLEMEPETNICFQMQEILCDQIKNISNKKRIFQMQKRIFRMQEILCDHRPRRREQLEAWEVEHKWWRHLCLPGQYHHHLNHLHHHHLNP